MYLVLYTVQFWLRFHGHSTRLDTQGSIIAHSVYSNTTNNPRLRMRLSTLLEPLHLLCQFGRGTLGVPITV